MTNVPNYVANWMSWISIKLWFNSIDQFYNHNETVLLKTGMTALYPWYLIKFLSLLISYQVWLIKEESAWENLLVKERNVANLVWHINCPLKRRDCIFCFTNHIMCKFISHVAMYPCFWWRFDAFIRPFPSNRPPAGYVLPHALWTVRKNST